MTDGSGSSSTFGGETFEFPCERFRLLLVFPVDRDFPIFETSNFFPAAERARSKTWSVRSSKKGAREEEIEMEKKKRKRTSSHSFSHLVSAHRIPTIQRPEHEREESSSLKTRC